MRSTSNTLVVGYGGFGCNCVRRFSEENECPVILIDSHSADYQSLPPFADYLEVGEDEFLDESRLRNSFSGYRNIVLVSSLGGESFNYAYERISNCARQLEISTISICTMPYMFESERRERSFENLNSLSGTTRGLFVIDSQKTIRGDCSYAEHLENTGTFISTSINVIVDLLEHSPFFSLCSAETYTFGIGSSKVFLDAVASAMDNPYYQVDKIRGKVIACLGKQPSESDVETLASSLLIRTGSLPETVVASMIGEDSVLLVIPISCRQHE